MRQPLRRADRFLAVPIRPRAGEYPTPPLWQGLAWRFLPKGRVPAFFASPYMVPPLGACGAEDLVGRPGAMTSYQELDGAGGATTVYEVCCPGCGAMVARLDPLAQPVRGGEGSGGYANSLTALVPIWFRGCCGWFGSLRDGVWTGRRPPSVRRRGAAPAEGSLDDGVNADRPPRQGD